MPAVLHFIFSTLLFLAARFYFLRWYDFQHSQDYLLGALAATLLAALVVYVYFPRERIRAANRSHLLLSAILLLLLLPWGEWLQIGFLSNREDWSLQWLYQVFFVYACLTAAAWLPGISRLLESGAKTLVARLQKPPEWLYWVLPALAFLFALTLCIEFQGALPHVQDGVSYLFQAKVFASGRLWADSPAFPDFFCSPGDMIYSGNGKWFSIFLPGYPLLLSAGLILHATWIITPLLSGATLWFLMRFLKNEFRSPVAIGFAILYLCSPFVLLLSSEYMAHVPELAAVAAILYSISQCSRGKNVLRHSVLFFVVLAFGALIRVFTVYSFLFPILCWYFWNRIRAQNLAPLAAPALGMITGCGLLLLYQWLTSGSPFGSGYLLKYPEYRYGFGETFLHQTHTPLLGLENTSNHLNALNGFLTGWPSGAFFFPLVFLVFSRKFSVWEVLVMAGMSFLLLFQFFFVGIDLALGPRMIFLSVLPVLLLNVRGIQTAWNYASDRSRPGVAVLLFACAGMFLLVSGPGFLRRFDHSRQPNVLLGEEISKHAGQKLLIFTTEDARYTDTFVFNSPDLRGNTVVARDLGGRNADLVQAYPGYTPFYFRKKESLVKTKGSLETGSAFILSPDRGNTGTDRISYYKLLSSVQKTAEFRREDLFDTMPATVLAYHCATIESFLRESRQKAVTSSQDSYQQKFHAELDTLIQFLSLPQCAYERNHGNWQTAFDPAEFRTLLDSVRQQGKENPDLSTEIDAGLNKIAQRIDRNQDGLLSDAEITDYVGKKIKDLRGLSFLEGN